MLSRAGRIGVMIGLVIFASPQLALFSATEFA